LHLALEHDLLLGGDVARRLAGHRAAIRVGDDRHLVLVVHPRERGLEVLVLAALGAVVDHVRLGGQTVSGLDVEGLLTGPVGRGLALVRMQRERARERLRELTSPERLVAVAARVRVRVLADRPRREGVDDADADALAREAGGGDAVGPAELLRRVPADGEVTGLALELGQRRAVVLLRRRDRAVALRAGPGIAEAGRRRADLDARDARRREAGHAQHGPGHGGRDTRVTGGPADEPAGVLVDLQLPPERLLGGRDAAARADVPVRCLHAGDTQTRGAEPRAHRGDGSRRRLVPGAVLSRRQVVVERRAPGRGNRGHG